MTPLTALDLARIKFRRLGETKHTFDCPSCGGLAWAGRAHLQCSGRECEHITFAPLDILGLVWKASLKECAETAASIIGRRPDYAGATARSADREVLTAWFKLCRQPRTPQEIMTATAFAKQGLDMGALGLSAAVIDARKMSEFLKVASATGATFPDQWLTEPPTTSLVYCVQSSPHTIDRVVVLSGRSTQHITWYKRRAGWNGLLEASPGCMQLLTESKFEALSLQFKLKKTGHTPHVLSAYYDDSAEFTEAAWLPDEIPITAIVSGNTSLINLQKAIDQFPGMEDALVATAEAALLSITPHDGVVPWNAMRLIAIKRINLPGAKRIDPKSAFIFEQTGSRPDDAAALVASFMREGSIDLARDMRRLSENHIIFQDSTCKVHETYNSYRIFNRHEARDVANFSLRLQSSVIFGEVNSEVYYRCIVGHGSQKTEALISRNALESVRHLQQELQVVAAAGDGVIPTVIDVGHMRGKVMPYLAQQAARIPTVRGISFLGWSPDRKRFQASGVSVEIDGVKKSKAVFHPAVQPLRPFSDVPAWSDACPEVTPDAQTLIAMMLAMTVRSYKRCATRPIKIVQTSDAITLLQGVMEAMGQAHILELNSNARDSRITNSGVNGYPCVAAGYSNQQINQSTATYAILSDEGFRVTDQITHQDAENAGRAAQFALIRLAEWCIATQADEFREIPSTDWHNSLMREGQWLIGHVCKLQPWEVRVKEESDLERVFSQIPLASIHDRMVILNGTTLRVDYAGLDVDVAGVVRECNGIGANCELKDNALLIPAAAIITAVHRFYGCDPGIRAVLT